MTEHGIEDNEQGSSVPHYGEGSYRKSYSFKAVWRSIGKICALSGCSLPVQSQGYCCEQHSRIAQEFSSGEAVVPFIVLGGFCSTDEVENTCAKALLYKAHYGYEVGVPLIVDDSIFSSHPARKPTVFEKPVYATAYIFFSSKSAKEMMFSDEENSYAWREHQTYCLDVEELGFVEQTIDVITLKLKFAANQEESDGWFMYSFSHSKYTINCVTFTPNNELQLTRLPKKTKNKVVAVKKKTMRVRIVQDGTPGPLTTMVVQDGTPGPLTTISDEEES